MTQWLYYSIYDVKFYERGVSWCCLVYIFKFCSATFWLEAYDFKLFTLFVVTYLTFFLFAYTIMQKEFSWDPSVAKLVKLEWEAKLKRRLTNVVSKLVRVNDYLPLWCQKVWKLGWEKLGHTKIQKEISSMFCKQEK